MEVRRFEDFDYESVQSWHQQRGLYTPTLAEYPSYGLICPGVAAGWLVLTDARYGILEFFITNKHAVGMHRHAALDTIVDDLIDYGRKFGLKYFKADTKDVDIGQRAMRHGFEFMGQFSMYFLR